jgi:hypothetical protein
MEQGQHLAHWTYQREEWLRFARIDWRLMRKYAWLTAAGLGIAGGSVYYLVHHFDDQALGLEAAALVGAYFGFTIGACLAAWAAWHWYHGWRRYRSALAGTGEAYIDATAVYFNGEYHQWGGRSGIRMFANEWVDGDPPYLQFTFEFAGTPFAASGHAARVTMPNKIFRIPIPSGRENEAKAILRRFSGTPSSA